MTNIDDHHVSGRSIEVNPQVLHTFGTNLGDEVYKNIRPGAQRLNIVFADGVRFGARSPSADLSAAAATYHDCLAGITQQLNAVVDAAAVLADSAESIAKRYATSDALATVRTADVLKAFDAAVIGRAARPQTSNTSERYE